ncbi:MAG: hypothetical protein P1V97_03735, partial [Planctomycetota bacterium]|nr:hypothetical protein [Planctomycetota bacterium]
MQQSLISKPFQGLLVFVSVVALLVLLSPGSAQSAPPAGSLKVGLVDLGIIFNKFKKKDVLEKGVRTMKKSFDTEMKKQNKLIRQLDKDAEELEGKKLQELEDRI